MLPDDGAEIESHAAFSVIVAASRVPVPVFFIVTVSGEASAAVNTSTPGVAVIYGPSTEGSAPYHISLAPILSVPSAHVLQGCPNSPRNSLVLQFQKRKWVALVCVGVTSC